MEREANKMPETPDLNEILQMAQNAQAELQKAQDNLDKIEVEGAAGGGMVRVRATAKGRIIGVDIDDSLLQPSEKAMLEDLIAAAFNDAKGKADAAAAVEMQKMTSTLPLPPGFKLPF
jgi:DNA-binding YbaB/EbfC family protein